MKTKQVTVYITTDGREFMTSNEAHHWEASISLQKLLDDNGVGSGGEWDQDMFSNFLREHANDLIPLLRRINDTKGSKQ